MCNELMTGLLYAGWHSNIIGPRSTLHSVHRSVLDSAGRSVSGEIKHSAVRGWSSRVGWAGTVRGQLVGTPWDNGVPTTRPLRFGEIGYEQITSLAQKLTF